MYIHGCDIFDINLTGVLVDLGCENGWKKYENNCYYMPEEKYNYTSAERVCERVNAHLTSIHTNEEREFIANMTQ